MKKLAWLCCLSLTASMGANAAALTPGTCFGTCGSGIANGDVPTTPTGSPYQYITTYEGPLAGGSLPIGFQLEDTNGSILTSAVFTADAGSLLEFNFLYLTSDGTETFPDYGWAALIDAATDSQVAQLFAARTNASGPIFPGFGLPPNAAVLSPSSVSLITGTTWEELGPDSGSCYGPGCGNTGWVNSRYTVTAAGNYYLAIGATNATDTAFDSGLAVDGVTLDDREVELGPGIPEPGSVSLLVCGLALMALRATTRRRG